MNTERKTREELLLENAELRARLAEAEETLHVIRSGTVDAVVVEGAQGDEQVFTLKGIDQTYRALVEGMHEGAATLTPDGDILYCNQYFADMVKTPLEQVIGSSMQRFVAAADQALLQALLHTEGSMNGRRELSLRAGDGKLVPVMLSVNVLEMEDVPGLCVVATDLTEQKRHEEMAASERLARSILEQAAEAIVVCDDKGYVIRASQIAHRLCGQNPLMQPFETMFPIRAPSGQGQPAEEQFSLAPILRGERLRGMEAHLSRPGGQQFSLLVSAAPLVGAQGQTLGCVVTLADVTELKRAEKELRERLKELACLYAVSRDVQEDLSVDELCRRVVEHLAPAMRFPEITVAVIELDGRRFTSEKVAEEPSHSLQAEIRVGGETCGQVWVYYAEERPFLLPQEQNLVNGVAEILGLWLEHKWAEEALRESEEKYRTLVSSINDLVMEIDSEGNFTYVGPQIFDMFGYTQEEAMGLAAFDFVHPDDIEKCMKALETMDEVKHIEYRSRHKDGHYVHVSTSGRIISDGVGGFKTVSVLRDITERVRAEEEIRRHLERIEALREIDRAITSTLNLTEVLDIILEELDRVIPYHSAGIFLLSDGTAKLTAGRGFPDLERALQVSFPVKDDPLTRELLQEKRPLVLADAQADERFLARGGADYVRAWIGLPLIVKDKAVGFLTIDHREPGIYDEESAEMAQAFGSQVAIAIENAWLYEQTQQRLQRITALREIDTAITASLNLHVTFHIILDQVTTQLGVDAADILLFNPHTQTLEYEAGRGFHSDALQHTRLRLGDGYAGLVALERRLINIPNLEEAENGLRRAPLLPQEAFIAYYAVPLIAKGQVQGVLEIFHRAPLEPDPEWLDFLETLASQVAMAIDNATLFENLKRSNVELTLAYDTTLEGWAKALELRDYETEGHSRRIVEMTLRLARTMGMSEEELTHVRRGTLLHDIGKIGVPDSILLKPGPLTEEEWEIMRQHPVYAYELLLPIAYLRPALDIPYCHHEKWDGTGYPRGLKGEEIPLAARVFAVVDVWDALRSDRPYREAWSEERALEHIREQAGKHFDPQVVEIFLKMMYER